MAKVRYQPETITVNSNTEDFSMNGYVIGQIKGSPMQGDYATDGTPNSTNGGEKEKALGYVRQGTRMEDTLVVEPNDFKYFVKYDLLGCEASNLDTVSYQYYKSTALTVPTPTLTNAPDGYEFGNWEDEAGTTYNGGASLTPTKDMRLHAVLTETAGD